MLNFYDVPSPGPAGGATVGMAEPTFSGAQAAIKDTWQPWFSSNSIRTFPHSLDVNLDEIAACLGAEDDKAGMPLNVAKHYIRVYLDETFAGGDIVSNEFMAELPQYHRAAADAVLAVAVSLSVAKKMGYHWFATKKAVNRLFPYLGPMWTKRWPLTKEGGPDYFMGRAFGDTAFFEVKGHAGIAKHPPEKFYASKTQSINAYFLKQPQRHILSIASFPADGFSALNVAVQWFNASNDSDEVEHTTPTPIHKLQQLIVAVCQFETQLRIYQQDFHGFIANPDEDWGFHPEGDVWIADSARPERVAVEEKARMIFGRIYELIDYLVSRHRIEGIFPDLGSRQFVSELDGAIGDLNSLIEGPLFVDSSLRRFRIRTLYRYSNGIRIVSLEDNSREVILRNRG